MAAHSALLDSPRPRKEGSRERLLAAAARAFCERGYVSVSVEDIAVAAGVSRMTFYRHFGGKAELTAALFHTNAAAHLPTILSIARQDFRDRQVVRNWIAAIFAADAEQRLLLRVFVQANVTEAQFTDEAHSFLHDILLGLGQGIPAFVLDPEAPADRRRWVEAWLLIYEILDQSNHAARGSGVATDRVIIDVLADRFVAFAGA